MTLSLTAPEFDLFRDLIEKECGISVHNDKMYLIETRLMKLVLENGCENFGEFYHKAKHDNPLKDKIVDAMTTNETLWFRDNTPYIALKEYLFPMMVEQMKSGQRSELNIWSAACSTGQEPYSMAMLLCEHFPALSRGAADILATDISRDAVEKGKTGRFTQVEVNRGLPITLLIKYFKQNGAFWHANDNLRRMINFQIFNLLSPFNFGTFDVIFCRYVLIYFEQQTKQQILEKLAKSLNPGGCLILGATETPIGLPAYMERVVSGKTTYWKKNA